jgi:hypothetical protein
MKTLIKTSAALSFIFVVLFLASYMLTTLDMGGHIRSNVLFMEYQIEIEFDTPDDPKYKGKYIMDRRIYQRKIWTFEDGYIFKGPWRAITPHPTTMG